MKKRILLSLLLLVTNFVFAKDLFADLLKQIQDTKLFYIYDSSARILPTEEETNGKISIKITINTNEEFTKIIKSEMDPDRFPSKENILFDDIKSYFKLEDNIFGFTFGDYMDFQWHNGKNLSYLRIYTQNKKRINTGTGTYGYRVFGSNYVYTIIILDPTDVTERNKEYDALSDLFYFKEGQKLDIQRGLEQTQGYYFVNGEASAKEFYQRLTRKDSSMPKSALKFQKAAEKLEEILNQY